MSNTCFTILHYHFTAHLRLALKPRLRINRLLAPRHGNSYLLILTQFTYTNDVTKNR